MATELINLIDEIVKYGIQPNLIVDNREVELERNLVRLYSLQFEIPNLFDENKYPPYQMSVSDLKKNIESNFSNFGYYKVILDINNFSNWDDIATGDAIDDLQDIIKELLEVKWRFQHNSDVDALWYFKFIFEAHIKDHLLGLLNYINELKHKVTD